MTYRNAVVIATGNPGKAREFGALLPDSLNVVGLSDLGIAGAEETGETFAENAELKALDASRQTNLLILADDSGLEVDALGGEPGVRSARYAGEPADDQRNIALLLERMRELPTGKRTARFVCELVLAQGGDVIARARGTCEGSIGFEPRGEHGFGYDPVFMLPTGQTMADLSDNEKNCISHRARAIRALPVDAFLGTPYPMRTP
jgi:XTP/dITP diphosphohydrolase